MRMADDDNTNSFDEPISRHEVHIEDYAFDTDSFPSIATQEELTRLTNSRDAPALEFNMPGPGGDIEREVNETVSREREARISYLTDRITEDRENMRENFRHAAGPDMEPLSCPLITDPSILYFSTKMMRFWDGEEAFQ